MAIPSGVMPKLLLRLRPSNASCIYYFHVWTRAPSINGPARLVKVTQACLRSARSRAMRDVLQCLAMAVTE